MSVLGVESPKDCSKKGLHLSNLNFPNRKRKLLTALFSTLFSILSFAFILWLTLRPSRPRFSLSAATAYDLGLPNATIDATFLVRNPNAHAGALYDRLRSRAAYAGLPITADAVLPPFDQLQGDSTSLVSTLLSSAGGPVAPAVAYGVARDVEMAGRVLVRLRVDGQLRWKVGAWVSRRYSLEVDCIAVVVLQPSPGGYPRPRVGVVQGSQCATNV